VNILLTFEIFTPVAGSKLLGEKVSILGTLAWNSSFRIPFYSVHSLGLWSGFKNLPLQLLVNQCFSQTFERLFSKNKCGRQSPQGWSVVKCREFAGKYLWNGLCPSHEITGFTLILLDFPRSKSRERRIPSKSSENRDCFLEQIWSGNRCYTCDYSADFWKVRNDSLTHTQRQYC